MDLIADSTSDIVLLHGTLNKKKHLKLFKSIAIVLTDKIAFLNEHNVPITKCSEECLEFESSVCFARLIGRAKSTISFFSIFVNIKKYVSISEVELSGSDQVSSTIELKILGNFFRKSLSETKLQYFTASKI